MTAQGKLYLASASPRRAEILSAHNIRFTLIANKLNREVLPKFSRDYRPHLRALVKEKANASHPKSEGYTLTADTIVILKNRQLGKPRDLHEAKQYLAQLSDQTHLVMTGICLLNNTKGTYTSRTAVTHVTFRHLSTTRIDTYISQHQVLDKAGAYGIQDLDNDILADRTGSYFNVMGLPIEILYPILQKHAIV